MCGVLIAVIFIAAVLAAVLIVVVHVLFRISRTVDDTARRVICIAISKGEEHEKVP